MQTLELVPCTYCKTLIALPFLTVDDEAFCGWECYRKHKNNKPYQQWLQLELRYDEALEDHICRGVE